MTERNELRVQENPLLERVAWNAAAYVVLAVMLLALLGSLEWLDRLAAPPVAIQSGHARREAVVSAARDEAVVVAGRNASRAAKVRGARRRFGLEATGREDCAPPPRGSG